MNQRGQMIPRGDNKWLLRIYIGRNAEGKRDYHSITVENHTTAQARQALTKLLRESDTDTLGRPTKLTLAEYVEQWYESKASIAQSTLNGYKLHMKLYILPALGHLKLHEITATKVQEAYNGLREAGLAPRTIEYAHIVLHQVMKKTIKLGFLVRNPTEDTERPAKVEREFTILSPDQMITLFKSEEGRRLYPLWLTLLSSGLRPQEALALRWCDLDGDTVRVQQVLERTATGGYIVVERRAKTKKSLRPVTLPAITLEALRIHKIQQTKEMLAYGPHYQRKDFIFASKIGSFLDPHNVRNRFKSALLRARLPQNVRLYDTRHSHFTALLNEGYNLSWIAARAGHSSVRVTEKVYAQVLPEAHKQMAEGTENIFKAAQQRKAAQR